MERSDFKIGGRFWTGSGSWICVDVGMRTILAVKEDDKEVQQSLKRDKVADSARSNYIVANSDQFKTSSFYPFDFGGCCTYNRFSK